LDTKEATKVTKIVVGPLQTNCFIINCIETSEAVIIDPGGDAEKIIETVENHDLNPVLIVSTHGHIDHVAAVSELKDYFKVNFAIHEEDRHILKASIEEAPLWGFHNVKEPPVEILLSQSDLIEFGNIRASILHTPGHTPGGISILLDGKVFVGDTIFASSIGRTDFPGGDFETLMNSIRDKLFTLPDDTTVYPGHGPETKIGIEKKSNPFTSGLI